MHTITSSVQRIGSSSRPVQRRSDVDFGRVPSPRRDSLLSSLSSNRSKGQASHSRASNLSRSIIPEEEEVLEDGPIDLSPPPEDYNPETPPRTPAPEESDNERTPRASQRASSARSRASFFQVPEDEDEDEQDEPQGEVEEDEEEDEVEQHMTAKSNKAKGKSREVEVEAEVEMEMEEDIEPEIAQGLDDIEQMPEEPFVQDEEPVETQTAKVRQRGEDNSLDKDPRPNKRARKEKGDENQGQKKTKGRPRKQDSVLREGSQLCIRDIACYSHPS